MRPRGKGVSKVDAGLQQDVARHTRMEIAARVEGHYRENVRLIKRLLLVWFLVSYGAALVVEVLNRITFLGFPFGYYMAAQGSIAVFVVLIFVYARKMEEIDRRYGVDE